jgi:uncharacterized ion transporter superfamily protein YfcC
MKRAKQIRFPDTVLIIMSIMVVFVILTWMIPAGEFQRVELNGRQVVVPGTYQEVDANPQGIADFLRAPIKGFIGASEIIAFVLLVGGAFTMLTRTGAVSAGIHSLIRSSQKNKRLKVWLIPITMTLFSLGGATFGMSEEVLVFVLVTIPLALALGYDAIVGVAISFVGAGAGFAGAFLNPFTVGVAQGIAEIPQFSGIGYRLIVWVVLTLISILFVMRYAKRIEKDPSKSLLHTDKDHAPLAAQANVSIAQFETRHSMILILLLIMMAVMVYGVINEDWYIQEITALFLGLGIGAAVIGKLKASEAVEAFKDGVKDMMMPALIIGLAKGLIVIATDGHIIDTILSGLAGSAEGLPKALAVEVIFIFQTGLNFFIPSGSGQAALTMPLMAPLSDLLEVERQVAVLAFQLGDGISNLIIPTSSVTMGVIGIAKIRYDIWLRWMMPLFIILTIAAMILLILPVVAFPWS